MFISKVTSSLLDRFTHLSFSMWGSFEIISELRRSLCLFVVFRPLSISFQASLFGLDKNSINLQSLEASCFTAWGPRAKLEEHFFIYSIVRHFRPKFEIELLLSLITANTKEIIFLDDRIAAVSQLISALHAPVLLQVNLLSFIQEAIFPLWFESKRWWTFVLLSHKFQSF